MFSKVALIGAGFVGSGWAIVFARSGYSVNVFDEDKSKRSTFIKTVEDCLVDLESNGLIKEGSNIIDKIKVSSSLEETVLGVSYVQESIFEEVKLKPVLLCKYHKLWDRSQNFHNFLVFYLRQSFIQNSLLLQRQKS